VGADREDTDLFLQNDDDVSHAVTIEERRDSQTEQLVTRTLTPDEQVRVRDFLPLYDVSYRAALRITIDGVLVRRILVGVNLEYDTLYVFVKDSETVTVRPRSQVWTETRTRTIADPLNRTDQD
jgi:hypothetical protein